MGEAEVAEGCGGGSGFVGEVAFDEGEGGNGRDGGGVEVVDGGLGELDGGGGERGVKCKYKKRILGPAHGVISIQGSCVETTMLCE